MEPDFDKMDGLVPAIVQDAASGRVLMLGYMDREAYLNTLTSGKVTFFSRSRQKLWTKGETSGHFLLLQEIRVDCDMDALLVTVNPIGPGVCHKGYKSCFFRSLIDDDWTIRDEQAFDAFVVYGGKG